MQFSQSHCLHWTLKLKCILLVVSNQRLLQTSSVTPPPLLLLPSPFTLAFLLYPSFSLSLFPRHRGDNSIKLSNKRKNKLTSKLVCVTPHLIWLNAICLFCSIMSKRLVSKRSVPCCVCSHCQSEAFQL